MLSLLLIIDSVNGFLMKSLHIYFPLSQIYKIVLQFLMLIYFFSLNSKKILSFLILVLLLIIPVFFNFIVSNDEYNYLETILQLDKFIYVILAFFLINEVIKRYGETALIRIKKVININLLVLIANLIMGILGFGHRQYKGGDIDIGTRGFFYAGNEMSGLILVLFSASLYFLYSKKNKGKYVIVSLLYLTLAVFSSTKVAIVGVLISILIIPNIKDKSLVDSVKRLSLKWVMVLFVGFGLGAVIVKNVIYRTGLIERWSFFYEKFSDNIISFLLSGRNITAKDQFRIFIDEYNLFHWIFGIGSDNYRIVEMDFIDILINYGIYGIIVFYGFSTIVFFKMIMNSRIQNYRYSRLAVYLFTVLFFISTFTGHVIFSAMTGIFISLIASLAFYKKIE